MIQQIQAAIVDRGSKQVNLHFKGLKAGPGRQRQPAGLNYLDLGDLVVYLSTESYVFLPDPDRCPERPLQPPIAILPGPWLVPGQPM
jgi:hypothetical protein